MPVQAASNVLSRAGPMRGRRTLGRRRSADGFSRGQSRGTLVTFMFVVLAVAIVCTPFLMLGPHLTFSVNPEGVGIDIGSTLVDPRESLVREFLPAAKRLRRHAETFIGSRMPAPVVAAKATVVGRNVGTPGEGDICLSMAFGVSSLELVTFAGSFRDVSPRADLVMFFEAPASPRFKEIIEKYDITALEIDTEQLKPEFLRLYHHSSTRWVLIQKYLDGKGSMYERVLIADVQETFFQRNPFDIIGDPGVYTFMEDDLIGENKLVYDSIESCLGPMALSKVANKPVLYSTVSLGTSILAIEYARQMSLGISSQVFRHCEKEGVGEALHNYLLYSGGVRGVLRFDQTSGPVVNIETGKYKLSESRVMNSAGQEVPIVRSYVEDTELTAEIFGRYIYWLDEINQGPSNGEPDLDRSVDAAVAHAANTCTQFVVREGVELFRGKCDDGGTSEVSVDRCCSSCLQRRRCLAFSYDKDMGLCYMKNCNEPNLPGDPINGIISGVKIVAVADR